MPQTFADKTSQLGMDPTLAKVIVTWPGLNSNTKAQILAITSLTGAFGTPGDAIADATATFSQTIMNNNFRALEDKVNAIIAALKA